MVIAANQDHFICRAKKFKYEFDWLIKQFSQLSIDKIESDPFSLSNGAEWYVRFHPNGDKDESKSYISIFLMLGKSLFNAKVSFKVKLVSRINEKTKEAEFANKCMIDGGYGWSKFIARDLIFDESNGYLVDDNLIVHCKVSVSIDRSPIHKENLLANQLLLLKSGEYNDCLLICQDGEVQANKTLLACQSSVFRAMFKNDLEEAKTGRVELTDIPKRIMQVKYESG